MITFTSIEKISEGIWKYSWTATTGPYRVYLNGILQDTVTTNEYVSSIQGYTNPPPLEILDVNDTDDALNIQYPAYLVLQWRRVNGAVSYAIEQYVDSAWVLQSRIYDDGSGYYSYTTEALDDVTEHQWRIKAADDYGNESSPLSFTALVVKNPDTPDVTIAYNESTKKVEIS